MVNINYEYYKIFYYAAKYKNLTQAAELLHSNQPNISRTIKLLEGEFGCPLFLRSNRGMTLTPEGEQLYSRIKTAVEQIQAGEKALLQSTQLKEGSVTIGVSETALHMLMLPVLNTFKNRFPNIRIRISNHLTTQAIDSLKKGLVDFAVVTTPAMLEKPLKAFPIINFHDILIGGPSYAFCKDRPLSLHDIAAYPLVCLGESTMTYQFYAEFYRSHNLPLKPELEAATNDQILPMVKNDLAIGYIPEVYASEALAKKEVYQLNLLEKIPERQICFVENQNHPLSIAAKELKALLISKECNK